MSLFDQLISSIAPHLCLGCGYEGAIICVQCFTNFEKIPSRCYRCCSLTIDGRVCDACRASSNLERVHVATAYKGLAKQAVWHLKFDGAQAAAGTMAGFMRPLCTAEKDGWLVPVPTASKRARIRGYDQATLLAKQLSRRGQLPYMDCLQRRGHTHQVGSSRRQRLSQLEGAFVVKNHARIAGKKIILVDDVLTTGATLEAAATVLKQAGAQEINAIVFAQA